MWRLGSDATKHVIERRNQPGVHIYIDNPQTHSRRGVKYQLLNDTLEHMWNLNYTAVLLTTGDNPTFALKFTGPKRGRLIEIGIGGTYYFYVWFCDNQRRETHIDTTKLFKLKGGEYMILTSDLFTLDNRRDQLKLYVNGKRSFENINLQFEGTWINQEAFSNTLTQHPRNFDNIVIKEHHFVYAPITDNLKKTAGQDYISFEYCKLCEFSAGGYAKIRGKYKQINPNIKGILIGFARAGFTRKLTFDYDPHTEVEFQVSAGEFLTYISSPDKFCGFEKWLPETAFVWVLVQNIVIKNIEIVSDFRNSWTFGSANTR